MLTDLNHSFSVIGLTETKRQVSRENILNNNITGYNFISQPSLLSCGGVGFYVSENINYSIREDLSLISNDFETLWIEIPSADLHHNIICGVIYRHNNGKLNMENFINYLDTITDKINRSNKYCVMMGDFNINLLNAETHTATDDFLNNLGSQFFSPHILQPTRITDHSATLIDNIFFNSLAHHTISGNIIYDISDHLPNFLININRYSAMPKNFKLYRRDYSNFNKEQFLSFKWKLSTFLFEIVVKILLFLPLWRLFFSSYCDGAK